MEVEKFENNVRRLLGEREIQPSPAGWEKLEQRLEKQKKKRPVMAWITSAAAIAAIFFVLGTYFNGAVTSEEPQIVEEETLKPTTKKATLEPEVIQIAASEEKRILKKEEKASADKASKNATFEAPVQESARTEVAVVVEKISEDITKGDIKNEVLATNSITESPENKNIFSTADEEAEALLLLAAAELEPDPVYTVSSKELLSQAEYELEQSFRDRVFEVVKEGLLKAKTAVANRDF